MENQAHSVRGSLTKAAQPTEGEKDVRIDFILLLNILHSVQYAPTQNM